MNNLASTYGELGRHEEALKLEEETLAFRKRVPTDHPDIARAWATSRVPTVSWDGTRRR